MSKCCSDSCQTKTTPESDTQAVLSGKFVSEFTIPKMDCPSEERMIRLILEDVEPKVGLVFDISNRKLAVYHDDNLSNKNTKLELLSYNVLWCDI
tara:strand:- start:165 stop:449 length:285 start_codon:yes stop_codon:yes gene_type:complete